MYLSGKAVSAMLPLEKPVRSFLEGIGSETHPGTKVPFIAVPTTAGTGSEATKNAVLSEIGPAGFKKSLRHDNLVPDMAILDPRLHLSCPRSVSAAGGMDAVTQLLEAYVSTKANPFTDALALEGLRLAGRGLPAVCADRGDSIDERGSMALAAYYSGIALAGAGLGAVHGFASSIGGRHPIPHGVVCARLLGPATRRTIELLNRDGSAARGFLVKYAHAGYALAGEETSEDIKAGCALLTTTIDEWAARFGIPRLREFGINDTEFNSLVGATSAKNNPGSPTRDDLAWILREAW